MSNKFMKYRDSWIISFFSVFVLFLFCNSEAQGARKVHMGVVLDGPYEKYDQYLGVFKKEINDLIRDEFAIRFSDEKTVVADWTFKGVNEAFVSLLEDPEVDIIISFGMFSSYIAATKGPYLKPVICPFVLDAKMQDAPLEGGKSGTENLHYLYPTSRQYSDFEFFHRVIAFKKIAIFVSQQAIDNFPGFKMNIMAALEAVGAKVQIVKVGNTIAGLQAAMDSDVDAVFIAPLPQLKRGELEKLIQEMIKRKLPTFSVIGEDEVEKGFLCATTPKTYYSKLARRVALNLQRILLGEAPSSLPAGFESKNQLIINMATARAINLVIPYSVLSDAKLLHEEDDSAKQQWTLATAVEKAIKSNADLAVARQEVISDKYDFQHAWNKLFPTIEVYSNGRIIDKDRAGASFGSAPERQISGTARLTQVVFSEKLLSNVIIQKHLQQTGTFSHDTVELDTAYNASVAYLNVLRTKTILQIKVDNLKRTKAYLGFAQTRNKIGVAGPSEVYRWESQIASSQTDVNNARSHYEIARRELNRQLNRPLVEPFNIKDVGLEDKALFFGAIWTEENITDDKKMTLMRQFMVEWAIKNSPELQGIWASIQAQKKVMASSKNAFIMPSVALTAELTRDFSEGGTGTGETDSFPFTPPETDDTEWMVGLQVSMPLFEGGAKITSHKKAIEDMTRLKLLRKSTLEKIKQRIRNAIHNCEASFPNIALSRTAAESSKKNLNLVSEAYSRGAISIQELLDAQNSAFVSEQLASNTIYTYLVDLMGVERASGLFMCFMTDQKRTKFFNELNIHFQKENL